MICLPMWDKLKRRIRRGRQTGREARRAHVVGYVKPILITCDRGVAQLGSASALGAEGRWFESSRPDHALRVWFNGRTSAFQADDAGSIPVTRSRTHRARASTRALLFWDVFFRSVILGQVLPPQGARQKACNALSHGALSHHSQAEGSSRLHSARCPWLDQSA